MSAVRTYSPDGLPEWTPIDDGASPHRSSRGIRGAAFDNPVIGSMAVGESSRTRETRQTREYKARAKVKP